SWCAEQRYRSSFPTRRSSDLTFEATVLGSLLAYVLGLVLALLRRSRIRVVSWVVWGFIEFVRSTPLLVQLYFLYNVLPDFGVRRSEEHTSESSHVKISYAVFC